MFDDLRAKLERIAARHAIDDFEMVLQTGDATSFKIEQKDLTLSSQVGIASLGLRLMKKGKIAYAPTTVFEKASLERLVEAALANLQSTSLKSFAEIPAGLSDETCDPRIVRLVKRPKELRDLLSRMVHNTWETGKGRFNILTGGGGVSTGERWVFTASSKEPAYNLSTQFSTYVDLDSRDFGFLVGRNLPNVSEIENLGAKLAKALPKRSLKPGDLGAAGKNIDVIVHPMCLSGIFATLVAEHIYASNKLQGLSRFKVGQKAASPSVTVVDDATHPELTSSAPTDDEGMVSQRNVLFDKGKFKTFLYDAETAVLDKASSTGNGMRRAVLAEKQNEAPVRPSLRGLVMEPGKTPLKEMIKGVTKGLYLKYLLGLHTADRVTGSFSNTAYVSYVIENGKIVATAEAGTWAVRGNALEFIRKITDISKERFNLGSALFPWVKTRFYIG